MEGELRVVNYGGVVKEEDEDSNLPGFRFHPTDEELVGFYLRRKVEDKPISMNIISQLDIYKYEPWDLPRFSKVGPGDKEWYFFCLRGRKYRNSVRPNRVAGGGFWKATGIDKQIYSSTSKYGDGCVGLKKSLVYYCGSAGKGVKTDWMMHEFRLLPAGKMLERNPSDESDAGPQEAEVWTICRIIKRNAPQKRTLQQQSMRSTNSSPTSSVSSPLHHHLQTPNLSSSCSFGQLPNEHDVIMAQCTTTATTNTILNASDIIRDWNWEEIGKMAEVMNNPNARLY